MDGVEESAEPFLILQNSLTKASRCGDAPVQVPCAPCEPDAVSPQDSAQD